MVIAWQSRETRSSSERGQPHSNHTVITWQSHSNHTVITQHAPLSLPRMLTLWLEYSDLTVEAAGAAPAKCASHAVIEALIAKLPLRLWLPSVPQVLLRQ